MLPLINVGVFMWIKESWDDVEINLDNISQEMIVGPSNMVAQRLSNINDRYLTARYIGGNRSMVEPIKPLSFTRTYRWSPGYKDTIKKVLWENLYQFGKKSGSLETMFNRERNAQYNSNHFKDQLLEVDNLLKELRTRKATTDTDVETAKGIVADLLSRMQEKMDEAELIFGLDKNIQHEFVFRYYRNESMEDEPTEEQVQLLRFLTGELELNLTYKNVEIPIVHSQLNKTYGKLDFCHDICLTFSMPFYIVFQSLFTRDFDTLNGNDVYGERYRIQRTIDNHLVGAGLSTNRSSFRYTDSSFLGWGGCKDMNGYRSFPYISSSNRDIEDIDRMHHVCYGNMQNDVQDAFVRLDFVSLADNLSHWMSYDLYDTNPLNQLTYSFVTIPADKFNADILEDYGQFNFEYMHDKLIGDCLPINMELFKELSYHTGDSWMPRNSDMEYALWSYGNISRKDYDENRESGIVFGWDCMHERYVPNKIQVTEALNYMHELGMIDKDKLELEEGTLHYKINLPLINKYYEFLYSVLSAVDFMLEEDKCLSRTYGHSVAIKRVITYIEDGMPRLDDKDDAEILANQIKETLVDPLQTIEVDPNADLPFGSMSSEEARQTLAELPDLPFESVDEPDVFTETAHLSVEEIQRRMDTQMMEDM